MRHNLPSVDGEKLRLVLDIKEAYSSGKLSLQQARHRLAEEVGKIFPWEIALAEQELQAFDENECRKEDIQQTLQLFEGIMDTSRPELPLDHPIMCYYRENDEMRKLLREVERLAPYPLIKNEWLALYEELAKWRTHLARKQNQLYSVLEQKGFDRPTTTMWLLDDFVRNEIRDTHRLLEENRDTEFIAKQQTIIHDVLDLIQKEESVLYPTALAMITAEEFEDMKSGDHEIGFAFISVEASKPSLQSSDTQTQDKGEGFATELGALLQKYGFSAGGFKRENEVLDVATGKLSLEQINLIYKHLPVDISYVDEHELVKFYSDTEHRIFPRSKNVIGRDVKNCHPRSSVHLVEEIIEKFRSGEEDSVDFWINKPGLFIYIYYVAIRDEEGKFRGVLEMMQDCTRIRELQDSRTLLKWSKDTSGASKSSPTQPTPKAEVQHASVEVYEDKTKAQQASQAPDHKSCGCDKADCHEEKLEITAATRVKDLLAHYPQLKAELPKLNPAFKMLNSPLARIIIPKATVQMMSERSGIPLEELIPQLHALIVKHPID